MVELIFDKEIISGSLEETESLAAQFLKQITPSAIVGLYGPLGSGKTTIVRFIASSAGVDPDDVSSPTFTLINEYLGGTVPIYHFDLYRLADPSEMYGIGAEEYFSRPGITLIEWAENGGRYIPANRFEIHLDIVDEQKRRIKFIRRTG